MKFHNKTPNALWQSASNVVVTVWSMRFSVLCAKSKIHHILLGWVWYVSETFRCCRKSSQKTGSCLSCKGAVHHHTVLTFHFLWWNGIVCHLQRFCAYTIFWTTLWTSTQTNSFSCELYTISRFQQHTWNNAKTLTFALLVFAPEVARQCKIKTAQNDDFIAPTRTQLLKVRFTSWIHICLRLFVWIQCTPYTALGLTGDQSKVHPASFMLKVWWDTLLRSFDHNQDKRIDW